jgi:spermidine/putrescine transport system ATP-binding protein
MQIELKRIQRDDGITFIFVTHDQEEALTLSDRIAVMSQGYVEQIGAPEDIYHHPSTVFVAGFIGQANLWDTNIASTNGSTADVMIGDQRVTGVAAGTFGVGSAAAFMVRPERVKVSVEQPDRTGASIRCNVIDYVFQGPVVRFALRSPDGTEIAAYVGADEQLPLLRPGDEVWAGWDRNAARILARDADRSAAELVDAPQ